MLDAVTQVDEAELDAKLEEVEKARSWSPRLVAKLEALLHSPDEASLMRMNPLAFARDKGVSPHEALDLFLHAARAGIVTMDWHLLCPACGMAVESFASLRSLHKGFFCSLCVLQTEASLDDYIQVSFSVAARIRRIRFHDPASLSADEYMFQLRCSREARFGENLAMSLADLLRPHFNALAWVAPGQPSRFELEVREGVLGSVEFEAHTGAAVDVDPAATSSTLAITIGETTMTASPSRLRPGRVQVEVVSHRATPVVFAMGGKPKAMSGQETPKAHFEPFVTGAMLLTNQTFRRLFRNETVQGSDGIGVRDVTVLFTDLKGSTALYEQIGDMRAFSMVQAHFERLGAVVQAHAGAIVKTIGDAIMAAFQRPLDAVRAALDMQQQIDRFNHERGRRDVVLKIGIHRGPSIAVTLNESLDYFGHTVNVAARVQGLADADEVFVTDDVYRTEGVAALLGAVESQDARLRGVQREVRVHKARRQPASSSP